MSTAEVARDMEVMRRAVGDSKLNYLGFSYGTAIGQYYANMFPDRFRTIAIDGVINPVAWAGSRATANIIQDDRLNSAGGAYKAFNEIMKRCDRAGTTRCVFAAGDAKARFKTITDRLKANPVTLAGGGTGSIEITYADFIADILDALYGTTAGDDVAALSQNMWTLTSSTSYTSSSALAMARSAYARTRQRLARARYDNSFDAFAAVMCTDGKHPSDASRWPAQAAAADRRAPYFGRAWAWASVPCASEHLDGQGRGRVRRPVQQAHPNTVLVVGSYWDPATNYHDAVASSRLLPNSRLLSSTNWGHTAYGTSSCVTRAMDRYLLNGALPAKGKVCAGDDQPFTTHVSARARSVATGQHKMLPPVARTLSNDDTRRSRTGGGRRRVLALPEGPAVVAPGAAGELGQHPPCLGPPGVQVAGAGKKLDQRPQRRELRVGPSVEQHLEPGHQVVQHGPPLVPRPVLVLPEPLGLQPGEIPDVVYRGHRSRRLGASLARTGAVGAAHWPGHRHASPPAANGCGPAVPAQVGGPVLGPDRTAAAPAARRRRHGRGPATNAIAGAAIAHRLPAGRQLDRLGHPPGLAALVDHPAVDRHERGEPAQHAEPQRGVDDRPLQRRGRRPRSGPPGRAAGPGPTAR